ncbi:MAG: type II toxin-antitoxin system HipA family toxin [Lachnospiraceae bacterium]|nr:type II toxin-antitoxin system HipA family toxin [Lachnospiraceae bacterium]
MEKEKRIFVYADWEAYENEPIGTIYVTQSRGRELFSFAYEESWLEQASIPLDPDLQLYAGRQYNSGEKELFGVFSDSCPDRWGRLLMRRREAIRARKAGEKPVRLLESDFLLGVYDEARMGGLRFKMDKEGDFLSSDKELATPPWTTLRELENASLSFENDENGLNEKWLKMLIAPGSSLGGARPKATVMAPDGSLWIAKFPSKHDEWNSGAWEMVVHELAGVCGLDVPEAKLEAFSKTGSTFLVKRFDREGKRRMHFSSAMTLLGKTDGASAIDGSSYLELVSFIRANGACPCKDLKELWKRIVFSMAVSNTDDHFRNHGFLLDKNGWRLSPLYDVNPDIYGDCLSLNVSEADASIDFDLALEVAEQFGLTRHEAENEIETVKNTVRTHWRELAKQYGLGRNAIEWMRPAFQICE